MLPFHHFIMTEALRFNESMGVYHLTSDNAEACRAAGLTLSTKIRSATGGKIWYTSGLSKAPANNPYAVLEWFDAADEATKRHLINLKRDYDASWAIESPMDMPVPSGINPYTNAPYEAMPFQRAGVEYCYKRGHCLIGDVPGLGKTVQAILLANLHDARRILVVCPANMRPHWRRFALAWSTIRHCSTYPIMRAQDGVHPTANYVVVSYDLLRNPAIQAALSREKWDLVVMDEAHYVKTVDARRTQALFGTGRFQINGGIIDNAKRMVALTGTPLLNRPRECYTLARHLHWESIDWLSYEGFVARYNPSNSWEERAGRLPELRARLRCNWMVRRHKEDVLKDLPDKRYEMVHVEPDGAIREVLRKESLLDFDPDKLFKNGAWQFDVDGDGTPISTLRREMGEAKVPRIIEHMRYLLDIVELEKVVLFCHHRSVITALAEGLSNYGVVVYWGGMTDTQKDDAKMRFIRAREIKIFLGQIDSSGLGLDGLQHVASHVVFGEPAWTPGANEQAADRCHRIGQHDNVLVQFLIAPGSFDEMVLNAVLGKVKTIDEALDGKAKVEKGSVA